MSRLSIRFRIGLKLIGFAQVILDAARIMMKADLVEITSSKRPLNVVPEYKVLTRDGDIESRYRFVDGKLCQVEHRQP